MISSSVTRINITVTHSRKLWMENTRMIIYWSQDPGLVSDDITNIEKIIKRRRIITNVVLTRGWGIDVRWKRAISDSRVIERRDMKYRDNISRPSPPSNHSFIR